MKKVILSMLAVIMLTTMSFTEAPKLPVTETPVPRFTKASVISKTFATSEMFAASKSLASYKGAKLPPQQVVVEYGVDYFPPGGGICMADRTTTWYYVPMHGWFIASQTYSNVMCIYP